MSKIKCIGIIAEDNSDFESVRTLIKRVINKKNISFKKSLGNGCGKLKRKAYDYIVDLTRRGCDMIILVHDLDRNNHKSLLEDLQEKIKDAPNQRKFICIPIEEIEGWFISDPKGIKTILKLNREPKFKGPPETIPSPKEKLGEQIHLCSNKSKIYLNTKHNQILSESISIDLMNQKCSSFRKLSEYVQQFAYA